MRNFINRLVFFIGWVLSPFTFWNDVFVNIPVAYIAANFLFLFVRIKFVTLLVTCYWLSNIAGLVMMYLSGKGMMRTRKDLRRELVKLFVTMAVYSAVLIVLAKMSILKPVYF